MRLGAADRRGYQTCRSHLSVRSAFLLLSVIVCLLPGASRADSSAEFVKALAELRERYAAGEGEQATFDVSRLYRRIARARRREGKPHDDVAEAVAAFYFEHEEYEKAIEYIETASELTPRGAEWDPVHRARVDLLTHYRAAYLEAAEPAIGKDIDAAIERHGSDSLEVAAQYWRLTRLYLEAGRRADGLRPMRLAWAIIEAELDTIDRELWHTLADTWFDLESEFGDAARAAPLSGPLLEFREQRDGLTDLGVVSYVERLVETLDAGGGHVTADLLQQERIRRLDLALGAGGEQAIALRKDLADRQREQERHAAAERTLLDLLEVLEKYGDNEDRAFARHDLGTVLEALGRGPEGAGIKNSAYSDLEDDRDPAVGEVGETLRVMAATAARKFDERRYEEAGSLLREWWRRANEDGLLDRSPYLFEITKELGRLCRELYLVPPDQQGHILEYCFSISDWHLDRSKGSALVHASYLTDDSDLYVMADDTMTAVDMLRQAWEVLRDEDLTANDAGFLSPRWSLALLVDKLVALGESELAREIADTAASHGIATTLRPDPGPVAVSSAEEEEIVRRKRAVETAVETCVPGDCCMSELLGEYVYVGAPGPSATAELTRRVLAMQEERLGTNDIDLVPTLQHLAAATEDEGERLALARRAAEILVDAPSRRLSCPSNTWSARFHAIQVKYMLAEPDPSLAERLSRTLLEDTRRVDGPDAEAAIRLMDDIVDIAANAGAEHALAVSRDFLAEVSSVGDTDAVDSDTLAMLHARHVEAVGDAVRSGRTVTPALIDEILKSMQRARNGEAARAFANLSARLRASDPQIAEKIRDRQDLARRIARLNTSLADETRPLDGAALTAVVKELGGLRERLAVLDETLLPASDSPAFDSLVSDSPAFDSLASDSLVVSSLAALQARLASDEALLVYLSGDDATHLVVVRAETSAYHRLSINETGVKVQVDAIRAALNLPDFTALPPFPRVNAAELHDLMFAPAEADLVGVGHILVVLDGAMRSLPPHVLIRHDPQRAVPLSSLDWLARHYAFSVLPSVSALEVLRASARPSRAVEPFLGVGAPALTGVDRVATFDASMLFQSALADPAALRRLAPVEGAAEELAALAKIADAGEGSVLVGADATETAVKDADLTRYSVIAFATHGLLSGDLGAITEPGLVMTPPATPTRVDDGLLTASEIAELRLDADWVILSACDTAGPGGDDAGGGLSGLAAAFIHAGSRRLLVSHWPVRTDAAARLTTGMFERLDGSSSLGRAEALRQTMMWMMDQGGEDGADAHPAVWAPFVLIGDGNARR